jgi:regulator of sirC expression with transglutaminase-like and TPR domain
MDTPRGRFAALVERGEGRLDLAEAALVVAQEEYPLLDPAPYLARLGELGGRVRRTLGQRHDAAAGIQALNLVLFKEEGFRGNEEDYYDPRNSFLNEVLDRRTGIPITLSLIYMEVARRAGLPVAGVGLPGHFIVSYLSPNKVTWIDPFDKGETLTEADCEKIVRRIYGGKVPFRRETLRPVPGFALLTRLLSNLKNIYIESNSHAKALSVIEKLLLLNPEDWGELRDRGVLWYQLKNRKAALADLEEYLRRAPAAEDRRDVQKLADTIRGALKEGK